MMNTERVEFDSGWDVQTTRDGDRTWVTVHQDGWVIGECYFNGSGWHASRRLSKTVPALVRDAIPASAKAAFSQEQAP